MPRLLARFMMIFGLVAGTPVLYLLVYAWIENNWLRRDELALLVTNVIVGLLLALAWIFAWHDVVPWTQKRGWWTGLSLPAAVLLALPIGMAIEAITGDDEIAVVLGGLTWFVVWIVSVSLIWAETPVERARRLARDTPRNIRCLQCGYNMTGLREARCPECGAAFTLDEIVAAARQLDDPWG